MMTPHPRILEALGTYVPGFKRWQCSICVSVLHVLQAIQHFTALCLFSSSTLYAIFINLFSLSESFSHFEIHEGWAMEIEPSTKWLVFG